MSHMHALLSNATCSCGIKAYSNRERRYRKPTKLSLLKLFPHLICLHRSTYVPSHSNPHGVSTMFPWLAVLPSRASESPQIIHTAFLWQHWVKDYVHVIISWYCTRSLQRLCKHGSINSLVWFVQWSTQANTNSDDLGCWACLSEEKHVLHVLEFSWLSHKNITQCHMRNHSNIYKCAKNRKVHGYIKKEDITLMCILLVVRLHASESYEWYEPFQSVWPRT